MYKIITQSLLKNLCNQSALTFKTVQPFSWKRHLYINKPGGSAIQNVTLIPGHGIGPEITDSVRKIYEAALVPIKFDVIDNFDLNDEECKKKLKKNYATLLGVILPNDRSKFYAENTQFYKFLDVFVQVVSVWSLPPETKISQQIHDHVDIVICRENTEGEYSGIEHEVYPGVMESLKVTTAAGSERVANYAFEFCYLSGRKKVTAVHKANIMKVCDGLFLDSCRKVAKKYPQIKYEEMIVDNTSMQLVKYPQQFDVILTTNLYGSILSNICAGITGGTGLCAGTLIGNDYAVFGQGTNHTGYKIAGQNIANPTAMIRSSIVMLRHLGLPRFADTIANALKDTLKEIEVHTPDVGGKGTTTQFTESVIKNLKKY